jgi:hypothetical protein
VWLLQLENLPGFYREADGQAKRTIPGCIFSEKLVFEKVLLRYHLRQGFGGQRKLRRIIEELQPPT